MAIDVDAFPPRIETYPQRPSLLLWSIIFKRSGTSAQGPASLHDLYPPLSNAGPNSRKFLLHYDGHPEDVIRGQRYRIHKENGEVIEGVSNEKGETSLAQSEIAEVVRIELLGKDKS